MNKAQMFLGMGSALAGVSLDDLINESISQVRKAEKKHKRIKTYVDSDTFKRHITSRPRRKRK